jgi:cell division protein FtsN
MIYKVFIGPFGTALDATHYQKSLKKKNVTGFIVDLTTF